MEFLTLGKSTIDLTGQSIDQWSVVGPTRRMKFPSGAEHIMWLCRCSCGNEKEVNGQSLRKQISKSCGCQNIEAVRKMGKANRRHGMKDTPEFEAWCQLRYRCQRQDHKQFPDYGGRGIKVCDRWKIFENFFEDMGKRPGKGYSIDRRNNNGDYEPSNCRWATSSTQNRNTRANITITAFGETRRLVDVMSNASDENLYTRTYQRIKSGWDHDSVYLMALLGR